MKKAERQHESILILKEHEKYVKRLNNEEAGQLFLALLAYADRGEIPGFYEEDQGSRLSMIFEMMTDTIDVNEKKYSAICEKRKVSGKKGGIRSGEVRRERSKRSNCFKDEANEADIDNDTVTVNDTESVSVIDTVTDTDSESISDSESPDSPGPLPEGGPESGADLFSLDQLLKKRTAGKVNLSDEGVKTFLEDMQADDWTMYGEPVEKRLILRTLREWANKHPEYAPVEPEEKPKRQLTILEKAAAIWKRDYADDRYPCEQMPSTWRNLIGTTLLDFMVRNDVSEGDIMCFCFCLEDAGLSYANGSEKITGYYGLISEYNDLYKWICDNLKEVFEIVGKNPDTTVKYDNQKREYFKLSGEQEERQQKQAETVATVAEEQVIQDRIEEAKEELQRRLDFDRITEADFLDYIIHVEKWFPEGTTISDLLELERESLPNKRFLSGFVFEDDTKVWGQISRAIKERQSQ